MATTTTAKKASGSGTAKKARAGSLTEQVYGQLRTEILTCALPPGTDLSEAELAARFDVSKTPVREALATLRQEGLIRTFPRRGYQVAMMTLSDIGELFDVRTILEAGIAELACTRITEPEIEKLAALADASYDPSARSSLGGFIDANRIFHMAIAHATGNARLEALLERQFDELERVFYLGATLRNVSEETANDHRDIVKVLAERNPARAREAMIHHNLVTRQGLFNALAQSNSFGHISL
ncbi:GntR family transcriptional regulator [Frigidibacter sp. MR17.14]|uniref:GntR family transcriptional regulator n=1 Tax=Frigidibacter sp. MR17.14 TaxID=3126509 RepID=UPI003012F707